MSTLTTALDSATVATDPTAETLSKWAYEAHCATCHECAHGDGWCPQGRALLSASAPHHDDLPGYGQATYPAI